MQIKPTLAILANRARSQSQQPDSEKDLKQAARPMPESTLRMPCLQSLSIYGVWASKL
ncbi:hypothetical protein GCM10008090_01460 [Arenicella chitinivorans]|uniref:Uncharacterized protein n=1 Tax=Arenicella chitinivorans TaxID=1329800 RepID=A0A918VGZ1_9GAMM|nr:hypothetical protein [Arenicella chitinivorans]GGZ96927.1 hypothetical protein GCM10008090_01460 [Arenicella chitinivorans]